MHNSTWMDGMMIYGKIKNQLGAAAGLWPNLYGKKKKLKKKKYKLTARQMKLWTPEFQIC